MIKGTSEKIYDHYQEKVIKVFGRKIISEYGAAAIVGGSIDHFTRNMTATIALETSKGNVSLGIVLGTILISLTLLISISLNFLNKNNDQSK